MHKNKTSEITAGLRHKERKTVMTPEELIDKANDLLLFTVSSTSERVRFTDGVPERVKKTEVTVSEPGEPSTMQYWFTDGKLTKILYAAPGEKEPEPVYRTGEDIRAVDLPEEFSQLLEFIPRKTEQEEEEALEYLRA
jgi:hypothetical protein